MWLELPKDTRPNSVHQHGSAGDRVIAGMSLRTMNRRLRIRHHAWGKPIGEIASEAGVTPDAISDTMRGLVPSDHAGYLIVSYLRTPTGPRALIHNRDVKAVSLARQRLSRKVRRLRGFASDHGIHVKAWTFIVAMTDQQLQSYYWNLESRVKTKFLEKYGELAQMYLLPDWWEPWQWYERLEQLKKDRYPDIYTTNQYG